MNISSVLVRTRPESLPKVQRDLAAIPGVEVHAASGEGHMVITVEDLEGRPVTDTVLSVQSMEGVLFTSMVYHYC